MEIKWYWPAELMGLVTDISAQSNGEYTYQVSAQTGDVIFFLFLSLIPLLFLAGILIRFWFARASRDSLGRRMIRCTSGALLVYAVLLAVGIGPYFQFYPRSAGFLDLSVIEHIAAGLYTAFLAVLLFFGSRFGLFLHNYCKKCGETP